MSAQTNRFHIEFTDSASSFCRSLSSYAFTSELVEFLKYKNRWQDSHQQEDYFYLHEKKAFLLGLINGLTYAGAIEDFERDRLEEVLKIPHLKNKAAIFRGLV